MIAIGDFCPAHIGGMPLLIRSCVNEIAVEDLEEGDVILHNDPYRGGLHTPEHTFFKPVFFDGDLIGFSVAIGHVCEVGGMSPAGFAGEATEVFHEGLRVPPVKIKKARQGRRRYLALLLANVTTPRYNYGRLPRPDLRHRSRRTAHDRIRPQIRKEELPRIVDALMDYSESRMRAEIEKIPDGRYVFEDYMENDGIEDQPYKIHAEVFVQNELFHDRRL